MTQRLVTLGIVLMALGGAAQAVAAATLPGGDRAERQDTSRATAPESPGILKCGHCGRNGPGLTGLASEGAALAVAAVTLPGGERAELQDTSTAVAPERPGILKCIPCGRNGTALTGLASDRASHTVESVTLPGGETIELRRTTGCDER